MSQEDFRRLVDATQLLQDIRDGKLEGTEALQKLAATKQFVFHGSPEKIEVLEPRQAYSGGKPDGVPGVAAGPDEAYELAVFMALVRSFKNRPNRSRGDRRSGFSIGGRTGDWKFEANQLAYEDATSPEAIGYVHVLTKKDFDVKHAEHEWRASKPVKPVLVVQVKAEDFRRLGDVKIIK